MVGLLDVNVLVALLVPEHQHHAIAISWFSREAARAGWATHRQVGVSGGAAGDYRQRGAGAGAGWDRQCACRGAVGGAAGVRGRDGLAGVTWSADDADRRRSYLRTSASSADDRLRVRARTRVRDARGPRGARTYRFVAIVTLSASPRSSCHPSLSPRARMQSRPQARATGSRSRGRLAARERASGVGRCRTPSHPGRRLR